MSTSRNWNEWYLGQSKNLVASNGPPLATNNINNLSGKQISNSSKQVAKEEQKQVEPQNMNNLIPASKIVIHVCDENRKVNKDFTCDKDVLLSQMKYFEKFRQNASSPSSVLEDLDISVHCDIQIFEWLMKYLQSPELQSQTLDVGTVISILISAEYLQMPQLLDECINYINNHLQEILKLSIDMTCISSGLLKKLASIAIIENLDEIKERKDKLVSKLYMKKLELLLEDESNVLFRCAYCNKLYTRSQKAWMICTKAKLFIDFHGNVIAEHVADRNWEINKFIHFLRQQGGLSWRETYWKIWSHLITLHCGICDRNFVGAEIWHCSFHSQRAKFNNGSNKGDYPCCKAPAIRFDTALKYSGCCAKSHELSNSWKTPDNEEKLEKILKRIHIVGEPFVSVKKQDEEIKKVGFENPRKTVNPQNNIAEFTPISKITDSPPLQLLLNNYIATVGESYCQIGDREEDEEEDDEDKTEFDFGDKSETNISTTEAEKTTDSEQVIFLKISLL